MYGNRGNQKRTEVIHERATQRTKSDLQLMSELYQREYAMKTSRADMIEDMVEVMRIIMHALANEGKEFKKAEVWHWVGKHV